MIEQITRFLRWCNADTEAEPLYVAQAKPAPLPYLDRMRQWLEMESRRLEWAGGGPLTPEQIERCMFRAEFYRHSPDLNAKLVEVLKPNRDKEREHQRLSRLSERLREHARRFPAGFFLRFEPW